MRWQEYKGADMKVEDILAGKSRVIHSIAPTASLLEAAKRLTDNQIGALICTDTAGGIVGMLSERSLAQAMARFGAKAVERQVAEVMNRDVIACAVDDNVDDLLMIMTETRCRHLPVVRDGEIAGLVSIGDLVKARIGSS